MNTVVTVFLQNWYFPYGAVKCSILVAGHLLDHHQWLFWQMYESAIQRHIIFWIAMRYSTHQNITENHSNLKVKKWKISYPIVAHIITKTVILSYILPHKNDINITMIDNCLCCYSSNNFLNYPLDLPTCFMHSVHFLHIFILKQYLSVFVSHNSELFFLILKANCVVIFVHCLTTAIAHGKACMSFQWYQLLIV